MLTIGADEAGRGALAGPIVGAAVCFKRPQDWGDLKDSKKYTPEKREEIFNILTGTNQAYIEYRVVDPCLIDYEGIQSCNCTVLSEPIWMLEDKYLQHVLYKEIKRIADGNLKLGGMIISEPKADENYREVAAASIVAKVLRDHIMIGYDKLWPEYGFSGHKGYWDEYHIEALKRYGRCLIHRKSYKIAALGEK